MKIRLFSDDTTDINVAVIVDSLTRLAPSFTWAKGRSSFHITEDFVQYPKSYSKLSTGVRNEIEQDDLAVLFTEKPYDNNYFWDAGESNAVIVSLYGWDHLTTLPKNNGAVYFIAALLVRALNIGQSHAAKNTGCINDFWADKTGVDAGMRSAFICGKCQPHGKHKLSDGLLIADIKTMLDDLSRASRADENIAAFWTVKLIPEAFDVFLCHSSQDKAAVRELNKQLKKDGLRTWLDEEQLPPGRPWQELLEKQIAEIGAVAIIVGKSGTGPWQDMELRAFITEFVKRRSATIPVILADCSVVPQLPLFLSQFTWVDFRKSTPPPIDQLVWGITGKRPMKSRSPQTKPKRRVRKKSNR